MTYFLCFCWRVEEENNFLWWLEKLWAASGPWQAARAASGPSPGPIFSKLNEFWMNFFQIRPARSRLYQRIFEFFLRVRWEGAFNSQFLKEKRQNSKKKEREKFEWKLQKSWFLRIFRLWGGPKEAISTSFWILSSRWRRMQPNLGPCEEINQKFNEILVKKFGRS